MRNFCDDAAHRGRIRAADRLIELRDAEALDDRLLFLRITDRAAVILYRDRSAGLIFVLICHDLQERVTRLRVNLNVTYAQRLFMPDGVTPAN